MSTGRGQIAPAFFRRKTNEQSHADILVDLPIALGGFRETGLEVWVISPHYKRPPPRIREQKHPLCTEGR
jgi:hypothetical protein